MMGVPVVDAPAAVPVLVPDALSFPPVIVTDVLIVVFLVVPVPVVVVLLGEGDSAGEAECQGRYSQSSHNTFHSHLRFHTSGACCEKNQIIACPVAPQIPERTKRDAATGCQGSPCFGLR